MTDLSKLRAQAGFAAKESVRLDDYQSAAAAYDISHRHGEDRRRFLLLGVFGEVGSVLSELKKKQRDAGAYFAYAESAREETGDVLWYLSQLCRELDLPMSKVWGRDSFADLQPQAHLFQTPASDDHVQRSLLNLASTAGQLLQTATEFEPNREALRRDIEAMFAALRAAADDAHISLELTALENLAKLESKWPQRRDWGLLYDADEDTDEQLPRRLEVTFREKTTPKGAKYVIQSVHGIHVGDRLTDNTADEDHYRFHDAFHLAYAAILGWSPVLRALLKVKRKSKPDVDEQQDGARAIITEEGIANWIFAHGLRHGDFANVDSLEFALLKTIRQMVRGYEVETRPLWMWERAILGGFACFRELKRYRSGVVIADLEERTLTFERLGE